MWPIIQSTLDQINAFWMILNAIATLGILLLLFVELPQIRRASALHEIEGLKLAIDRMQNPEFKSGVDIVLRVWHDGGGKYPAMIDGQIQEVLSGLDYIAKLVEIGCVNKMVLFYLFFDRLQTLEQAFNDFEGRHNSRIPEYQVLYPKGYELLKEIISFSPEMLGASQQKALRLG